MKLQRDTSFYQKCIKKYRWTIGACLFFIILKISTAFLLWDGRLIPPVPTDSFIYIGHIASVAQCPTLFFCQDSYSLQSFKGLEHFTYRVILGMLHLITGLSALSVYKLTFFIGPFLLLFSIYIFLRNFTKNDKELAILIIFLALFTGGGGYHGFYWVVPSYFAFIFFLLLYSVLLNDQERRPFLKITLYVVLGGFTHNIFFYLLSILGFHTVLSYFLERKSFFTKLKKLTFTFLVSIICYVPFSPFLSKILGLPISSSPYALESFFINADEFKSLSSVYLDYYQWIFFHWFGYILFFSTLFLLIYNKQFRFLSVFASSFLFVTIASFFPHGERSLIILWPMTFILFAFGFILIQKNILSYFKKVSTQKIFLCTTWFLFIIFTLLNISYSYLLIKRINEYENITISQQLVQELYQESLTRKVIPLVATNYNSSILSAYLFSFSQKPLSITTDLSQADLFVDISINNTSDTSKVAKIIGIISKELNIKRSTTTYRLDNSHILDSAFILKTKNSDYSLYTRKP